MPPEIGWPFIIVLVAFWILLRMEKPRDVLPPPSKDTDRKHDVGFWS